MEDITQELFNVMESENISRRFKQKTYDEINAMINQGKSKNTEKSTVGQCEYLMSGGKNDPKLYLISSKWMTMN